MYQYYQIFVLFDRRILHSEVTPLYMTHLLCLAGTQDFHLYEVILLLSSSLDLLHKQTGEKSTSMKLKLKVVQTAKKFCEVYET
jgi:hypothetical protein